MSVFASMKSQAFRVLAAMLSLLLACAMLVAMPAKAMATETAASAPDTATASIDYKDALNSSLAFILINTPAPAVGSIGGEWAVLALARAGIQPGDTVNGVTMPSNYYSDYAARVLADATDSSPWYSPADSIIDNNKATENERVTLGLTAAGFDASQFGPYNLLLPLSDQGYATWQGNNAITYALIALDSHNYALPTHPAAWAKASSRMSKDNTQSSRASLIKALLGNEANKGTASAGGWVLGSVGTNPDVDTTAMAIQALAPYYTDPDYPDVKPAVDRALTWLSNKQQDNGQFSFDTSGAASESSAQVVVALSALGIDPAADARFVKNGTSVLDAMMQFYVEGSGFKHLLAGNVDAMATEQCAYALVAYDRFVNHQNRLYDMTNTQLTVIKDPTAAAPGSGDIYGEGHATMSGALAVAQVVIGGGTELTPQQFAAADIDGDGTLTMADVILILTQASA